MISMKKLVSGLALSLVAVSAYAADSNRVLVTTGAEKGASAISLDVASDGRAVAVGVILTIPGLEKAKVDLSGCVSGLPKTHQGSCAVKGDEIRVGFFSSTNSALPAGVAAIGSVKIAGQVGPATVKMVEISDVNAEVLSSASELTK